MKNLISFSELTNAGANILDGTKEYFDERHPYLDTEVPGVCWRNQMGGWGTCRYKFIKLIPIYIIFPFISMMLNS